MRPRHTSSWLICVLVFSAASIPAWASTTGPAARPHSRAAHAAKPPAATRATVKRGVPAASKPAGKSAGPRTLQDIHIEGEIPVPQVLFVTARDQRRFVDFQTQRYLKTSQEVGEQTVFPSRIAVTGSQPTDEPKENRP